MPTTTKRFYIVKADDHAVVKTVPVSVCAAPHRIDITAATDAPTSLVPSTAPLAETSTEAGGDGTVAVKTASRRPGLLHRPHLPHIGRPGR